MFGINSEDGHADISDFEMLEFDPLEEYNGRLDIGEMLDDQGVTSDFKNQPNGKYGVDMEDVEILSD